MMMTQVVPYSLDQAEMAGPHGSLVAWDGFYFQAKAATLAEQAEGRGCGQEGAWPTAQDGEDGWACRVRAGSRSAKSTMKQELSGFVSAALHKNWENLAPTSTSSEIQSLFVSRVPAKNSVARLVSGNTFRVKMYVFLAPPRIHAL